jgi:hypothetical protein
MHQFTLFILFDCKFMFIDIIFLFYQKESEFNYFLLGKNNYYFLYEIMNEIINSFIQFKLRNYINFIYLENIYED